MIGFPVCIPLLELFQFSLLLLFFGQPMILFTWLVYSLFLRIDLVLLFFFGFWPTSLSHSRRQFDWSIQGFKEVLRLFLAIWLFRLFLLVWFRKREWLGVSFLLYLLKLLLLLQRLEILSNRVFFRRLFFFLNMRVQKAFVEAHHACFWVGSLSFIFLRLLIFLLAEKFLLFLLSLESGCDELFDVGILAKFFFDFQLLHSFPSCILLQFTQLLLLFKAIDVPWLCLHIVLLP